ncbi:hypothetical protein ABU162_22270 [Paenibacillus thiaminolyticus]|uniref:hypothetical protein n=1 Tax=Paenibacillus thiaminolyticus TaxID=49283 RepID=UPI0035A71AA0
MWGISLNIEMEHWIRMLQPAPLFRVQNNRCLPGIEPFREQITYSLQPDLFSIASGLF